MIEFFLKETLPKHYGINPDSVAVPIYRKQNPFTEFDSKACDDAVGVSYNKEGAFNKFTEVCSTCDHIVLKVDNKGQEITVVSFEKYLNDLPKQITNQNRCDLIMTDGVQHNKIVFCDLCCYDDRYIGPNEGSHPERKRAFARNQMAESVEMFMDIDVLNQYILTYPEKICLFAYKSYNAIQQPVAAQRGNAELNMQAMITSASSVSGQVIIENIVMNHRFTFVQNKYPSVYNW